MSSSVSLLAVDAVPILFTGIFGLIVGSFLNVVVLRLNTGSTLGGRSRCMSCGQQLVWFELIPFFSFLFQKGKCRHCDTKLDIQYPFVELGTGVVFATLFIFLTQTISWPTVWLAWGFYSIIFSLLIVITAYDIRHKIIPNSVVYPFIVLAVVSYFLNFGFNTVGFRPIEAALFTSLDFWTGPIFFAFFGLLWLISGGRWMGFGDAKLVIGIGFLLGFAAGITSLMIAFWIAAIVGIFSLLLYRGSLTMKSEVPFAPFLILALYLEFLFGWQFLLLV